MFHSQIPKANEDATYLGLPNTLGRNESIVLCYLKGKIKGRIKGWDKKMLSEGGRKFC